MLLGRERFALSSAGPEPAILDRKIIWDEVRDQFLLWAQGRFGDRYIRDLRKTLDKHKPAIAGAEDVDRIFAGQFLAGIGLGIVYMRTRNLVPVIIMHYILDFMPPVFAYIL